MGAFAPFTTRESADERADRCGARETDVALIARVLGDVDVGPASVAAAVPCLHQLLECGVRVCFHVDQC